LCLTGLKRLESGALVKDYEDADREYELALQLAVPEVISEDPRYVERGPPTIAEEFPDGSKVFFLGEHAYGFAARVHATTTDSLSFILAFSLSDRAENAAFKSVATRRTDAQYIPSFQVAEMLAMSKRALSRVTSSFMVLVADGQKINLGLSIKFEAKGMKVLNYSNKHGNVWQFSNLAIDLIRDYKVCTALLCEIEMLTFRLQEKYPEVFRILDRGGDGMEIFPSVEQ
jgi:Exoribonuclease Xrn1 D2/D3 domain/Exoribonuclease Xrn1 D1 domain